MVKKQNLPLLSCNRCDFSTKNRYIFTRHKNRCSKSAIPGLRRNQPAVTKVKPVEEGGDEAVGIAEGTTTPTAAATDMGVAVEAMETASNSDDEPISSLQARVASSTTSKMPKVILKVKSGGINKSRGQPKRNYKCEDCNFRTVKSKAYLYHLLEKHDGSFSIFPCLFCDYACRYKHKLMRHIKMVHHAAPNSDEIQAENVGLGSKERVASETPLPEKEIVPKSVTTLSVKRAYKKQNPVKVKPGLKTTAAEYILDLAKSESSPHFKCKLCLYSSRMRARVYNHVISCHINAKQFQCKLCKFSTVKKSEFYAHKSQHDSQKVFSCPDCAYTTGFKPNYERHRINHKKQFRYKCIFCSYTSDHEGALKRHVMNSHPDSQSETSKVMEEANASHTGTGKYVSDDDDDQWAEDDEEELELLPGFKRCEYCGFLGMSEEEIAEHVATHSRVAFYPCQICKLKYKRSGDLNRHMKLKHNLRLKDFIRRQGTKYQIEILNSGEVNIPAVDVSKEKMAHKLNDKGNSRNIQEDDDEIHFRQQTEDEPLDLSMSSPEKTPTKGGGVEVELKCRHCSYVAKWPSDLRRHMVVHSVEKRFKCRFCLRKYKYAGDLNVHLRRDHRVEPDTNIRTEKPPPSPKKKPGMFKCATCPYTSPFRSEIERHSRSHTDTKPHHCILCDYQSHWKGDVKRHLQKHHPEVLNGDVTLEDFIETSYENEPSPSPSNRKDAKTGGNKTPTSTEKAKSLSPQESPQEPAESQHSDDMSAKEPVFKCKYCDFTASAPSKLKAHVITHVNLKQWKCPVCPRRSNWKWDIRKHIQKDHPDRANAQVIMLTEEEAKATIQDYISKSTMPKRENHLDNMNIAEAQDELKFPYRCSACGYNSAYRWEVSKHIRMTHPGENCSVLVAFSTETTDDDSRTSPAKDTSKMENKKVYKQTTLKQAGLKGLVDSKPESLSDLSRKRTRSKKADENLQNRPFMCGECGKRCSNNGDVKKHYHYMHPEKEVRVVYLGSSAITTPVAGEHSPTGNKVAKKLNYESKYNNPKVLGYIKPFKCSVCHRRSNWKWDINKHMRESHAGVPCHLIILSEEEARATLASYVPPNQQQALSRARLAQTTTAVDGSNPATGNDNMSPSKQTIFRNLKQFKCSACSYRSDWRSDTHRHIKNKHGRARAVIVTLDPDQAKSTLEQYMYRRKGIERRLFLSKGSSQSLTRASSAEEKENSDLQPSGKGRIWKCSKCSFSHKERRQVCIHLRTHKLKPFNCTLCGHSSNYRSALYRHLRTKHNSNDFSLCHVTMRYAKEGKGSSQDGEGELTVDEMEELEAEKEAEMEEELQELETESSVPEGKRGFHCKLCDFQTAWRSCVIRHLKEKHKSSDFSLCGIKIVDLSAMKKKGRKKYQCTKCPYQTEKPGLLKFHMTYHKPQPGNRYKCKYCPYYVCAKRLLHQHLRIHAEAVGKLPAAVDSKPASVTPKRYQCEKCPFRTGSKNDILYHKQFHRPRPSATFKCDFCDYWVTHRRLLKQHYRMHKSAETTASPVKQPCVATVTASPCKSEATDASWFYNPVDAASIKQQVISSKITRGFPSGVGLSPTKNSSSPGGYVMRNGVFRKLHHCRYCPYVNVRGRNLRLHEKMHGWRLSDKPLFQCNQCNYMVGSKGLLSHHMKVHTKGYGADPTDNTTAELENLEGVHVEGDEHSDRSSEISDQQHDNRMDALLEIARFKKYACEKCPYASAKRNHFERHLELHGSRQRYICDFCDYSVPSNNLLAQHQKLHLMPNQNLLAVQSIANLQHLPEITADVAVASFLSAYNPEKEKTVSVTHDHMELYENHPDPPDEPKKLYRCDRCPYANVRRDHILAHLKFHMIRSELACPYCDYSVSKSHLLTQHIKVHFSPLPEFSEWLQQTGIQNRDTKDTAVMDEAKQEVSFKQDFVSSDDVQPMETTTDTKTDSDMMAADESEDVKTVLPSMSVMKEEGDKSVVTVGNADKDGVAVEQRVDEGEVGGVKPSGSSTYICQYCDREFPASEQLVCHEMQHLIGNHFEAGQPVELPSPVGDSDQCEDPKATETTSVQDTSVPMET